MAINGYGATITFAPDGGQAVPVGRLTSIGRVRADAEALDVTTLDGGGWRQFMQGWRDAGEVELTGYHDGADAGQRALRDAYLTGAAGQVAVTFSDGCQVGFRAFVKAHSLGAAEVDGAVGFGAVLRVTGAVSVTPGEA